MYHRNPRLFSFLSRRRRAKHKAAKCNSFFYTPRLRGAPLHLRVDSGLAAPPRPSARASGSRAASSLHPRTPRSRRETGTRAAAAQQELHRERPPAPAAARHKHARTKAPRPAFHVPLTRPSKRVAPHRGRRHGAFAGRSVLSRLSQQTKFTCAVEHNVGRCQLRSSPSSTFAIDIRCVASAP